VWEMWGRREGPRRGRRVRGCVSSRKGWGVLV
jgi:hypothetical protein